jgi:hypothetical protein
MCCEISNFILQPIDFIKKNLIKINRTLMFLDIHQKSAVVFSIILISQSPNLNLIDSLQGVRDEVFQAVE